MREVLGEVPRDAATVTDHAIAGVRRDERLRRRGDSDRDGSLDPRVGVVSLDRDVLEVEGVDLGHRGVQPKSRQRTRVAGELEAGLVDVVGVQVGVAEGVHEVTDGKPLTCATM